MVRIVFFSLIFIFSCEFLNPTEVNIISDNQFLEIQDTDYTLIDVRTTEEYESGHIQNALNFDFYSESFQKDILTLEKNSQIILYCRTQNRSTKTADFLKENGYRDIKVIEGGITSWVKNGNDLVYSISE